MCAFGRTFLFWDTAIIYPSIFQVNFHSMSFLEQINAYISGEDVSQRPMGRECVKRNVGDSVRTFLEGDGRSRGSLQRGRSRVMDSVARGRGTSEELHEVACALTSMSRSDRREYLTRVTPSSRRLLLDEGSRIRRCVTDSCIQYSPEVCWAISRVIDRDDARGYEYLNANRSKLPDEVKVWLDAFNADRHSTEAMEAMEKLGPYRLVKDDSRVQAFLEGASNQETELNDIVNNAVSQTEVLSEKTQEVLEDVNEQAVDMASTFLETMMDMYEANISDVVASEVESVAKEGTLGVLEQGVEESDVEAEIDPQAQVSGEEVLKEVTEEPKEEPKDDDVQDSVEDQRGMVNREKGGFMPVRKTKRVDDADEDFEYVVHGTFDQDDADWRERSEATDWEHTDLYRIQPRREYLGLQEDGSYGVRYFSPSGINSEVMTLHEKDYKRNLERDRELHGEDGRKRLGASGYVSDSAEYPAVPVAVGAQVQVSYMGNLYNGRIASAGNGCVVVEGLPFEYFSARSQAGCFTGTSADMMFPYGESIMIIEDVPMPSDEQPLVAEEAPVLEGESADVVVEEQPIDEVVEESETEVELGDSTDKIEDATDEELAEKFTDLNRAVFASEYMDVSLDDLEQADDEGKGYKAPDGHTMYFYEREELEDAGLMAGDKYDEEVGYFIFDGDKMQPVDYREASQPVFNQDYEGADALLMVSDEDIKSLEGIDKLRIQLGNLIPAVKKQRSRGKGLPMYSWNDYGITINRIPKGRGFVSPEEHTALALVRNFSDGTSSVVAFFYPTEGFRELFERINAGEYTDSDFDAMFPEYKDDFHRIAQSLVNGAISEGLIKKEDQDTLRMSLRNVITDAADFLYSVDRIIDEVLSGKDFVRSDEAESIMADADGDDQYIIFMDSESTDVIPASEAKAYLKANLGRFDSLFKDLGIEILNDVDDATEQPITDADGVTTMADVSAGVPAVIEEEVKVKEDELSGNTWSFLNDAVEQWGKDYCFELGQNPETSQLVDAAKVLSASISDVLKDVRLDASVPRILCRDQRFIDVKADGVYVGTVLFVYQTSDSGIDAFASGIAEAAVQLAHKIYDRVEVTEEVEVKDANDGEMLSEAAKDEVITAVEREIKEGLEAKGIVIEDSVSIDIDKVKDGGVNTFDIPHTASTFHKVRDTKRVMDSVLAVASESMGERVTNALYRSLQKSSSKRAQEKVRKVVDTAILMGELDLVCPELYKERLTDSHWVCDSAHTVMQAFGQSVDGVADSRCLLATEPFECADRKITSFKVGSRELFLLQ